MSVLVFIQNFDGKLRKQNFELASFAAEMANESGGVLNAVVFGKIEDSQLNALGNYGVEKVFHVDDERLNSRINKAYTKLVEEIASETNASIIVFPDNNTGKALGPRLSVRLKAGFVPGVVKTPSSYEPFTVQKKVFSGKAFANVKVNSEKKILSLIINSFGVKENFKSIEIQKYTPNLNDTDIQVHVAETIPAADGVSLADAEIVVSGGRGLKGPENWRPLEELAETLNAAKACSRPVSDDGWRSHEEHVGQTGKIIAPNLYIAIGISGAIQHVAGVSGSKHIVAINNDPEAPIFKVADYGIVGDAMSILPELNNALKEYKAENA